MLHADFAWSFVHISIHIHMSLERKQVETLKKAENPCD